MILKNKIISYADNRTLYAEVASPSERTNVTNSLNRDLAKIQSWSSTWGMKLNPRKTGDAELRRHWLTPTMKYRFFLCK